MKKYTNWIISAILLIIFLIIGFYLITIENNVVDKTIYNAIIKIKSDISTKIFKVITFLASVKFMVIVSFITLVIRQIKNRTLILINILTNTILNLFLKNIFKRARPLDIMLVNEIGYSFPSGHTMIATTFYGFIIYLINKSNVSKKIKIIITILLTTLILLIGLSRIYLGVHYATDVIGGYLISISYLILFINFNKKEIKERVK